MTVGFLPLERVVRRSTHGGKAATLGRLLRAGLPVPPGLAISPGQSPRGDPVVTAILALQNGKGAQIPLAVRSSAVGEDGRDASYAGRFESVLGCYTFSEACAAAELVRTSASAARVAAYQERKKGDTAPVRVGVIFQRLVNATHSAVVFTRHPMPTGPSDPDDVVVEVTEGLGDRLVSGRVEPATWEYGRDDKLWAHRAGPMIEVPARNQLVQLALKCEKVIRAPADVEATFDGEMWWIVQARPITTLPKPRRKGTRK